MTGHVHAGAGASAAPPCDRPDLLRFDHMRADASSRTTRRTRTRRCRSTTSSVRRRRARPSRTRWRCTRTSTSRSASARRPRHPCGLARPRTSPQLPGRSHAPQSAPSNTYRLQLCTAAHSFALLHAGRGTLETCFWAPDVHDGSGSGMLLRPATLWPRATPQAAWPRLP